MLIDDVKVIEVILFVENIPLSIEYLMKKSKFSESRVLAALSAIQEEYDKDYHGICLERSIEELKERREIENEEGEKVQVEEIKTIEKFALTPKKSMYENLRNVYGKKADSRILRAAMETLSIIAYQQGITRSEISAIRGVASDNIIKELKNKKFIKIIGRNSELPGNPIKYGTTEKFLHEFNLSSIDDLPYLSDIQSTKYEEKDDEGNVLSGRVIKKRMKEEFQNSLKAKKEKSIAAEEQHKEDEKEVILFQDLSDDPADSQQTSQTGEDGGSSSDTKE